jgi:Glyoxalase-like domain
MATRVQVAIDCKDTTVLEAFWATALHYVAPPPPPGFARWFDYWSSLDLPEDEVDDTAGQLVDPDGVGPRLFFLPVPEPKTVKNRVHLDLDVGGGREVPLAIRSARVDAEAARLEAAGATRLRVLHETADHYGIVMQDPEGNEFCLH